MGRSYADKVKGKKKNTSGRKGSVKDSEKPGFPMAPVVVLGIIITLIIAAVIVYQNDDNGDDGSSGNLDTDDDIKGGPEYLNIDLESTSQGLIELNDHYGKVIVLDMFATWCAPCEAQIKELKILDARYSDSDVVILSVDVDSRETLGMVREFKSEHDADWTFAMSNERFTSNFPASSIPTLYILNRQGVKVEEHVGLINANELADKIDPYI